MEIKELQRNWDLFGRTDPLWSILTAPRGPNRRWNEEEFFQSGIRDIEAVFARLHTLAGAPKRGRALDFGCGVGRLTQALCVHFDSVVGVDIAPSMIELANGYNRFGRRCEYVINERDDLTRFADGSFDFVFTLIVLQHMRPEYACRYLAEFFRVTAPGGLIVFQLPSALKLDRSRLLPADAFHARIELAKPVSAMQAGHRYTLAFQVMNASGCEWPSLPQGKAMALNLGNHWRDAKGTMLMQDDARAQIPRLSSGETARVELGVLAPEIPGTYVLEVDVVQEGAAWFAARGSPTCRSKIDVVRAEAPPAVPASPAQQALEARMEMHCLPRRRVEDLIQAEGGELLAADEHYSCGEEYENYQYFVRKRPPPSFLGRAARRSKRLAGSLLRTARAAARRWCVRSL